MTNTDYILITPRLGLRLWRETDLAPFAAMNADAEVMRYFPSTMTTEQTAGFPPVRAVVSTDRSSQECRVKHPPRR